VGVSVGVRLGVTVCVGVSVRVGVALFVGVWLGVSVKRGVGDAVDVDVPTNIAVCTPSPVMNTPAEITETATTRTSNHSTIERRFELRCAEVIKPDHDTTHA
jgi:hypothetical protein